MDKESEGKKLRTEYRGSLPDADGYFDAYGGRYVPETLMEPLAELETAYAAVLKDEGFAEKLNGLLSEYVGRPTPLYHAARLSEYLENRVFLKREDLCHTGAHKINNALGQALLAKRMGKKRVIAETGAGQHGVATATVCALLGLDCEVYMGTTDIHRQALNVYRMELLGAKVIEVKTGSQTLKDAINEALRDWVTNVDSTYYLLGSALGPHPYPMIVRDFQKIIGEEARRQILSTTGALPDRLVACVGGGSNAIGLFYDFLDDARVKMVGVEAGGKGDETGEHSARFLTGRPGSLHGTFSYLLQDESGQVAETCSISAGLDYPSVGPEHSCLMERNRVFYTSVRDDLVLKSFRLLSSLEGIAPALESAHAVGYLVREKDALKGETIILNLSGRGDKDVQAVADLEENAALKVE